MEGLIFTGAHVWSLGMEMGRCQTSNPTQPIDWPPLIVFQILISSKSPLICYSKLTHTNMHLTSKHGICPILIHIMKPYHSSSNIYPRATSTSKAVALTRHLIKHIHHVHQSKKFTMFINYIILTNQIKCMFM